MERSPIDPSKAAFAPWSIALAAFWPKPNIPIHALVKALQLGGIFDVEQGRLNMRGIGETRQLGPDPGNHLLGDGLRQPPRFVCGLKSENRSARWMSKRIRKISDCFGGGGLVAATVGISPLPLFSVKDRIRYLLSVPTARRTYDRCA